jgi:hypothetical protein
VFEVVAALILVAALLGVTGIATYVAYRLFRGAR